ncbi:MAG: ATPase [Bacteroidia bacterium]|nr:ATPase [Bacteroidia bacterium]
MILIAESGSTKTDWCLITGNEVLSNATTPGLNPYFVDTIAVAEIIGKQVLPKLQSTKDISKVFFYGAGCTTEENCNIIKGALKQHFPASEIYVLSDMIGAARALCGNEAGYVAILGTGSNSCAFKNDKIVEQVSSLGFILGDEGSGGDIGKRLLRAYFYKVLPPHLMLAFEKEYSLTLSEALNSIYKKPQPNKFIASFSKFVSENPSPDLTKMVADSFSDFLQNHIMRYNTLESGTPVHFTGSIAFSFKDILIQQVHAKNLVLGRILQSPMEGLVKFHVE